MGEIFILISPFKIRFSPNYVYKFGLYLTKNTVYRRYEIQRFNDFLINNHFLVRIIKNVNILCVQNCILFNLKF